MYHRYFQLIPLVGPKVIWISKYNSLLQIAALSPVAGQDYGLSLEYAAPSVSTPALFFTKESVSSSWNILVSSSSKAGILKTFEGEITFTVFFKL